MHPDYLEFIRLLNRREVEYVIAGGYAVNIYGYSRMTENIDILFKADQTVGANLLKAIRDFNIDTSELKDHDFSKPTHLRIGESPNSIDLINETAGIDAGEIFNRGKEISIEGTKLKVIAFEDLIENKKALHTYKDIADVDHLTMIRGKK